MRVPTDGKFYGAYACMKFTAWGPRWRDLVVQNKVNLVYVKMRLPYVSPNRSAQSAGRLARGGGMVLRGSGKARSMLGWSAHGRGDRQFRPIRSAAQDAFGRSW